MKNLIVSQEWFTIMKDPCSLIVSVSFDLELLYALGSNGHVYCFSSYDFFQRQIAAFSLQGTSCDDSTWFLVQYVADLNELACVSYSGCIETIKCGDFQSLDSVQSEVETLSEQVGVVDGGIAAASWSPDRLTLALITNNNTVMCMPTTWDDVLETSIEARIPPGASSPASISWCGDGESFVILSVDASDCVTRIRVFSKALQLLAVGKTVNSPGILRSVGPVASFSPNGSMIVTAQRKSSEKLMVAILEKNGLFHGDFEIQTPQAVGREWIVTDLHWDLMSTVLAVSLALSSGSSPASTSANASTTASGIHAVQLYTRSNYHWYLKQEWQEPGVRCLGFDQERPDRLYLFHFIGSSSVVRSVDWSWDLCRSRGRECSIAVMDGRKLLLTPLGRCVVPPPMSLVQVAMPAPARCSAFFRIVSMQATTGPAPDPESDSPPPSTTLGTVTDKDAWGLACLCGTSLCVIVGDDAGCVRQSSNIEISDVSECTGLFVRAIVASACGGDGQSSPIVHVLLGGTTVTGECSGSALGTVEKTWNEEHHDELRLLCLRMEGAGLESISSEAVRIPGRVLCMTDSSDHSFEQESSIAFAVGVVHNETFEVWLVERSGPSLGLRKLVSIPEPCTRIEVVQRSSDNGLAVLGLCPKGRLYCNDTLLASGINSFVCNSSSDKEMDMDTLLCVTGGTKPLLRFLSLSAVTAMDSEMGLDSEQVVELGEARPVERGARLIAAVSGDAKVIIQLPRGNLEAFEPRPLLLRRARQLLDAGKTLDCLVLLRRQRIDLNLLVDHAPAGFLAEIPRFVKAALEKDAELLSLLISSLTLDDVTITKYRRVNSKDRGVDSVDTVIPSGWGALDTERGGNKVNCVCEALRVVLLEHFHAGVDKALQPLLCTYAKSLPPLLIQALSLIKEVASRAVGVHSSSTSASEAMLNTPKVQSAIKYLSFLADSTQLFEAALGDCDFGFARIIAKQAQMDPKQYLPLITSFEAVGTSGPAFISENELDSLISERDATSLGSFLDKLMHHRVAMHLKRPEEAVRWGVSAFEVVSRGVDEALAVALQSKLNELSNVIVQTASSNDLQKTSLILCQESIARIASQQQSNAAEDSLGAGSPVTRSPLDVLLSRLLKSYASFCERKGRAREAVLTYLMTHPPSVAAAVSAARQYGDWQWAITIAARHESPPALEGSSNHSRSGENEESGQGLTARAVAQEIVDTYMTGLEQGQGAGDKYAAVGLGVVDSSGSGSSVGDGDRSLEVAQLCVDYCGDVEQAVQLCRLARHWQEAVRMSCRHGRRDLMQEVFSECVATAKDAITVLSSMTGEYVEAVSELKTLWLDPASRLSQVASTESALAKQLAAQAREDAQSDDGRDNRSEFSAATGTASVFSRQSVLSSRSGASASSYASFKSSMSSVSAASSSSNLSSASNKFSVVGIDHALLSRGQASDDRVAVDQKRKKRKARNLGDSKDVWGLKREGKVAAKVWMLSDLASIVKTVDSLCSTLLLIGDSASIALASRLQTAVDDFVSLLRRQPAPEAPAYPVEWLRSRDMSAVTHFQRDTAQSKVDGETGEIHRAGSQLELWWGRVITGLSLWEEKRTVCLPSALPVVL